MRKREEKAAQASSEAYVSRGQAALPGAAGDGKVHDLEYWLASGLLTLPKR